MPADSPMRTFDPVKVARHERDNWAAYYLKRWGWLLRVSVGLVRESFGLSLLQSFYGAYLVGRAEIAAAPFPNNNLPRAEAYMRRFYGLVQRVHGEDFDVAQAAHLEVNWWVVHRQLFGQTDNQPLIDALTELYAATYRVAPARVQAAAAARAEAMIYSDRWVNEGRALGSPLLAQVEEALVRSYTALRAAVGPATVPAAAPHTR